MDVLAALALSSQVPLSSDLQKSKDLTKEDREIQPMMTRHVYF
jgi:hypothetical protein